MGNDSTEVALQQGSKMSYRVGSDVSHNIYNKRRQTCTRREFPKEFKNSAPFIRQVSNALNITYGSKEKTDSSTPKNAFRNGCRYLVVAPLCKSASMSGKPVEIRQIQRDSVGWNVTLTSRVDRRHIDTRVSLRCKRREGTKHITRQSEHAD